MTRKTRRPGQNSRHGTPPHRCPPRPGGRQHSPHRSPVLAATVTGSLRQLSTLRHLPVARSPPTHSNKD